MQNLLSLGINYERFSLAEYNYSGTTYRSDFKLTSAQPKLSQSKSWPQGLLLSSRTPVMPLGFLVVQCCNRLFPLTSDAKVYVLTLLCSCCHSDTALHSYILLEHQTQIGMQGPPATAQRHCKLCDGAYTI